MESQFSEHSINAIKVFLLVVKVFSYRVLYDILKPLSAVPIYKNLWFAITSWSKTSALSIIIQETLKKFRQIEWFSLEFLRTANCIWTSAFCISHGNIFKKNAYLLFKSIYIFGLHNFSWWWTLKCSHVWLKSCYFSFIWNLLDSFFWFLFHSSILRMTKWEFYIWSFQTSHNFTDFCDIPVLHEENITHLIIPVPFLQNLW